ncbi:hypothetical protein FOPE_09432 [Fonsecaea pedrosoi]|nr:hypothetical protein FOPE_09432 [Fonsecaea pedrosoi]
MSSFENLHGRLANGGDPPKRPLRIAGASGGVFDRFRSLQDLSADPEIDVIIGDWLGELNMTHRAAQKAHQNAKGTTSSGAGSYEVIFVDCLRPALKNIAKNRQKVCSNAGVTDAEGLAKVVVQMCQEQGVDLKVSWIEGDDVTDAALKMVSAGEEFASLPSDTKLSDWGHGPIFAQCYLGAVGIAEAFRAGADIVLCGRVADASPCVGAAMWWHNWKTDQYTELAHALVAGHLIECSNYVTGGYYSGFKKEVLDACQDMGFPIAEIEANGEFNVTKEKNKQGIVTPGSCISQLLYEIQGPLYYNSDVMAQIDLIRMDSVGEARVHVSNVIGHPPPPTTKVGFTAVGGYSAEFHYFLTGLDIEEKAKMVEMQTLASMGEYRKEFHTLTFTVTGYSRPNPRNLNEATVDLRIFAQTRNPDIISAGKNVVVKPETPCFARWCLENCLQGYPGSTMALDMRQAMGRPYFEYWATLIPQSVVDHKVHHFSGAVQSISAPAVTKEYPRHQDSYDTANPLPADSWGPVVSAPLGHIVMGRSGDKSSDCNVGLFVRHADEWDWLRSTLSIQKIQELLEQDYKGGRIDRFEFPNIFAVHFLLRDHLDRGCNASSSYDTLGKLCCEYLRAKYVDIPVKFLDRGII